MAKEVHFMLGGKGGIAKSGLMANFAEYKLLKGQSVAVYNTDFINKTITDWEALSATSINVCKKDAKGVDRVDPNGMDELVNHIINTDAEVVIVDNGGNSYTIMCEYWHDNNLGQVLRDIGVEKVVVHTVIKGGGNIGATHDCASHITSKLDEQTVIWDNQWEGSTARDGKEIRDTALFRDNNKVSFVTSRAPDAGVAATLQIFMPTHKLFSEIQKKPELAGLDLMGGLRVHTWIKELWGNMEAAGL